MMRTRRDRTRAQFNRKPEEGGGVRLVWRNPFSAESGREALSGLEERKSVTVGYYLQLPPEVAGDRGGAWCFCPSDTPHALAALTVPAVMDRVGADLVELLRGGSRLEP